MSMTQREVNELPDAQRDALYSLHKRSGIEWNDFLEKCYPPGGIAPYVSVTDFHGMFVGIEPDGYTHT